MGKVIITAPTFIGQKPSPKGVKQTFAVACYYKKSSGAKWTKVEIGEEFTLLPNLSVQIKCVVPYNDVQNFAPFTLTKSFRGAFETVTPVFKASEPVKITLKNGNTDVRLCNFYRNGKAFSRDFTDYGEDAPRQWGTTFTDEQPGGLTWKGFKDGDYLLAWDSDGSYQVVVSAYNKKYSSVLTDLIPVEEIDKTKTAIVDLIPDDASPFLNVTPVQSAQLDKESRGKTYRSAYKVEDNTIYIVPKDDAFAAYIECGPTKQYEGYNSSLTFECGDVKHIDPCKTMLAVGQIPNRAMHKFILPEKGTEHTITISTKDNVSVTIKVVKELP